MQDQPKRFLDRVYDIASDAETRSFYDEWAGTYNDEVLGNDYQQPRRCASALIAALPPGPNTTLIDIGCGSGLSGVALRAAGYATIDGCDFSPGMLAQANETGAYRRLFETNLNEPPMPVDDGAYDAATCVGVFSFGHVMADALDDITRVIRPGGVLLIGLNDHFYQEGSVTAKLDALVEAGILTARRDEHGEHLPGTGLTGWVITAHKG